MASYTPNLNLLKKSPVTDGNDTFNVDTMLNENWDKIDEALGDPTEAAQKLGLTGDLSAAASLGVLATVGDLYVWRRTVVKGAAGYTLGPVETGTVNFGGRDSSDRPPSVQYSSVVNVSEDGELSLESPNSWQIDPTPGGPEFAMSNIRGKFFSIVGYGNSFFEKNSIYYCPSDAVFTGVTTESPAYLSVDKYQTVTFVPPGTYIDYPVSTNPNAYQVGSDAKPSGYTLGDVVSGSFKICPPGTSSKYGVSYWSYSDSIFVDENGSVYLSSPSNMDVSTISDSGAVERNFVGKFVSLTGSSESYTSDLKKGNVYFIPSDASVSKSGGAYTVSKYQKVNGYAAIPGGTTIEYPGKLGDKSRIVTGSYVGTGTYGQSNPTKISLPYEPKAFFVQCFGNLGGNLQEPAFGMFFGECLLGVELNYFDGRAGTIGQTMCYTSFENGFFEWYSYGNNSAEYQFNSSGFTYTWRAIL